ncbi:MAG: hypothetical protein A2161_10935 [Candidatus Schekmanbacteria bacterium RBG_13_48_7]|uniref:Alcohol dehydrogenase-like N-terminal domain-containing protein n=1 Tax=Candidatus Schekmanbacteria bacterium RBG_13_48_7 TaxID=1817878 RepID=A0A1F7S217_9BACT|nr:MAG: hypothetical protein A2161_10935 [Candidatus Schekmanbacteria bacterium RBG_13_48_7]
MKALYFDGKKYTYKPNFPEPVTRDDEMLIQVIKSGICNTDLEIGKGYMQFVGVPGHEFVGRVTAGTRKDLIGKRVVGEINIPCGVCDYCVNNGEPRHCPERQVLGILNHQGTFAAYITLPAQNLHPVPDTISDEAAVFVEPLAAALRIQEQMVFEPSDHVAVIGDGKLGILIAAVLSLRGMKVCLIGRHPERAGLPILNNVQFISETEVSKGFKFQVVVDASGTGEGFKLAFNLVKPCGTVILKSTLAGVYQSSLNIAVINEIRIVGSRCGPFMPALQMLADRKIDPRCLIHSEYPIEDGEKALKVAATPGVLKVLLKIL